MIHPWWADIVFGFLFGIGLVIAQALGRLILK